MQLEQRVPTADEQRHILCRLHQLILDACSEERLQYYPIEEVPADRLISSDDSTDPVPADERDRQAFFRDPRLSAEKMRRYRKENRFGPIRTLLRPILTDRNIDAGTDVQTFRKFLDLAIQFAVHAFDTAEAERNSSAGPIDLEKLMAMIPPSDAVTGSVDNATGQAPSLPGALAPSAAYINAGHASPPMSSFIDGFLEDDKEHVSGGTAGQKTASLKLLVRIVGDIPADSIMLANAGMR